MAANDYSFVTVWRVDAPPAVVYDVLADAEAYSRWWPEVYLDVRLERPAGGGDVGSVVHLRTRGKLPYTLTWSAETVRAERPRLLEVRARGDFDGTGTWTLEPCGTGTRARFEWRLRAEKPLLRYLSVALKPLFEWNHRWAMAKGFEGLVRETARRSASTEAGAAL